jgi:uncharacterized protein
MSLLYFKKKIKNILLLFAKTEFHTDRFLKLAISNAEKLNLPLEILKISLSEKVKNNSEKRCYFCKYEIFKHIKDEFPGYKIVDGTNYSDIFDYRPGLEALKEYKIISPFKENNIGKREILQYLENNGLHDFIMPPTTCLATRITYNKKINEKLLKIVDSGELYLIENEVKFCRIRVNDNKIFSVESFPEYFNKINLLLPKLYELLNADKITVKEYIKKSV